MNKPRFVIFAKDIQAMTGVSLRQAQSTLQNIRKDFSRKKNHLVTIAEYCAFSEHTIEEVSDYFTGNKNNH